MTTRDGSEIPHHDLPMESANGYWIKDADYAPEDGLHKGHRIVIVNPEAQIKAPAPTRVEGKVVMVLKDAKVVYVRCETCLMSWFFDEGERLA